jgi:hypothetical protein
MVAATTYREVADDGEAGLRWGLGNRAEVGVEEVEGVLGVIIRIQCLEASFLRHVQDEGEGVAAKGAAPVSSADSDRHGKGAIAGRSAMIECSRSRES